MEAGFLLTLNQPRGKHEGHGSLPFRVHWCCAVLIASSRASGPGANLPSQKLAHILVWYGDGRIPGLRSCEEVSITGFA